jgi:DNA adenine methylase
MKGKAILSINDHPDIRKAFAKFQMDTTGIAYTGDGGGKAVERQELVIYSWDKQADPVGLF